MGLSLIFKFNYNVFVGLLSVIPFATCIVFVNKLEDSHIVDYPSALYNIITYYTPEAIRVQSVVFLFDIFVAIYYLFNSKYLMKFRNMIGIFQVDAEPYEKSVLSGLILTSMLAFFVKCLALTISCYFDFNIISELEGITNDLIWSHDQIEISEDMVKYRRIALITLIFNIFLWFFWFVYTSLNCYFTAMDYIKVNESERDPRDQYMTVDDRGSTDLELESFNNQNMLFLGEDSGELNQRMTNK